MSNKANRNEINTPKQLAAYIDNYHICNMCRTARWETMPTLFKTVSPVFRPTEFYNDDAREKVQKLPVKTYSSYCRACSTGRTLNRKYKKPGHELATDVPDECVSKYHVLILDWEKTTKIRYTYNVLEKNDKLCKIDIPTELALDVQKHQELTDKIKQLEEERNEQSDKIKQLISKYEVVNNSNQSLHGEIADLKSVIGDLKADKDELPDQTKMYIQDIYNMIFKTDNGHRAPRTFKKSYWRLMSDTFVPLLNTLSILGANISKGQRELITS